MNSGEIGTAARRWRGKGDERGAVVGSEDEGAPGGRILQLVEAVGVVEAVAAVRWRQRQRRVRSCVNSTREERSRVGWRVR